MSLSRRELFGLFRRPASGPVAPAAVEAAAVEAPAPAGFSLDGFYAARAPAASLPVFAVRRPVAPELVPRIVEHACLATRSFCSVCHERCPRPGAIVVTAGRPRVIDEACDGCGRCLAACPAPVLAFELVPRAPITHREVP